MPRAVLPLLTRLLAIAAIIGILALFYWFFRPRPQFVISIDRGRVTVRRGKVPGRFVAECQQICAEWGIDRGTVKGVPVSGRVSLRFSREIPPEHHQRLRNAWGLFS